MFRLGSEVAGSFGLGHPSGSGGSGHRNADAVTSKRGQRLRNILRSSKNKSLSLSSQSHPRAWSKPQVLGPRRPLPVRRSQRKRGKSSGSGNLRVHVFFFFGGGGGVRSL